ncbi:hypothetical protein [Saccharopolyspora taberi]|uniref:Uncharacterized protein n=1 Tax=Saccharopolyspora taberi TaxID=60895 RepID=A0ABN3V8H2_9PSEU
MTWPSDQAGYYNDMREWRDRLPCGGTVGVMGPTGCAFNNTEGKEQLPEIKLRLIR